jgi:hypothetical protein
LKRESKRRYAITTRPLNPEEQQKLHGILAKHAERGKFDATGLIRALECAIIEYGRKSRPTVTSNVVGKELRAIAKASEALRRRLEGVSRTAWLLLETGMAQLLVDAYRESRSEDWERADIGDHSFADRVLADPDLLKHLTTRAAKASEESAGQLIGKGGGRPPDVEHPAHGLVTRICYVLRKYRIPTRPNSRTAYEAVLRVAFSAAGLGAIADPLAIARRMDVMIE